MKRYLAALALAALTVGSVPAGATNLSNVSAGGLSSDNIEFVTTVPYALDTVGGRLIGKYFYANDQQKLMIFDVKDPLNPSLTGVLPMPQEALLSREDIDGNGKILIIPNLTPRKVPPSKTPPGTTLNIIDVEDKSNPTILASLEGAGQHTFSCILKCKWAYGSDGNIVDLRNPADPKLLKEKWGDGKPARGGHDVEEVAPGLVLTATQPIMLLDARKNPAKPKLLAVGANDDRRFIHTPRWARNGKDKFLLMAGETNFKARCNESNGAFMTWDASKWKKTRTFKMIDEYRVKNGTYADGSPAVNAMGCSSHWHEAHPRFKNGGLVAAAFFEHGTRMIQVSKKGKINEIGWFLPARGSTGAVYWITDRILYAVNYGGGIDVLRYTGKI